MDNEQMRAVRLAAMEIAECFQPLHDLIAGEVAYFLGQGFTEEQARAMAAAEFVNAFGLRIEHGATRFGDDETPTSR